MQTIATKIYNKSISVLSRHLSRGVILLYHRTTNLESDPQLLAVTPERFEEHMEILQRHYNPVPLEELCKQAERGRVAPRSVAVTFDDGYEDNYLYAKPVLEKYEIPATVFVSTGYIGEEKELWWDEIERLLLVEQEPAISLDGKGDGVEHFGREGWGGYTEKNNGAISWNVLSTETPTIKHELYTYLCKRFQSMTSEQIDAALCDLREWAGKGALARKSHMPMTIDQVLNLANTGLIEIGAHTRSHVNLAAQSLDAQKREMVGSKKDLEEWLGREVPSFSYPLGNRHHYNKDSMRLAKESGF
ncbi:polysaccharide deacetylase family protein, partial [bacterium]|nr:polysaccharide deacetylase family protein [bacterium]